MPVLTKPLESDGMGSTTRCNRRSDTAHLALHSREFWVRLVAMFALFCLCIVTAVYAGCFAHRRAPILYKLNSCLSDDDCPEGSKCIDQICIREVE